MVKAFVASSAPKYDLFNCIKVGLTYILAFSFGRLDCKNSPQSHIMRVYNAGHDKSGVFHSAEWNVGDWSSDGIREAWLVFFIWVVNFWLG
ncbi:hypothetical protein TNCV_3141251 [Trichonephila clavipes]|nr:hypothetical protein TNCV_3141251 [Trichonephila clavipes]